MCILATVGAGGRNSRADVRCVQLLLNLNRDAPLTVDGLCGRGTIAAIRAFQAAAGIEESGAICTGDPTLAALRKAVPGQLSRDTFWGCVANAGAGLIDRYWGVLAQCLERNQINTPLRIAHFLAQVGHESGDLRYQEELADGSAYEGRKDLGNIQPGDGPRFKGRGLIQLTGRTNYTKYGQARDRDFLTGDNPRKIATDPALAVDVAGWYWDTRGLNKWADQDDVGEITRRINGGFNGLEDRKQRLARAKWFLVG